LQQYRNSFHRYQLSKIVATVTEKSVLANRITIFASMVWTKQMLTFYAYMRAFLPTFLWENCYCLRDVWLHILSSHAAKLGPCMYSGRFVG